MYPPPPLNRNCLPFSWASLIKILWFVSQICPQSNYQSRLCWKYNGVPWLCGNVLSFSYSSFVCMSDSAISLFCFVRTTYMLYLIFTSSYPHTAILINRRRIYYTTFFCILIKRCILNVFWSSQMHILSLWNSSVHLSSWLCVFITDGEMIEYFAASRLVYCYFVYVNSFVIS